ncbi:MULTISPECIES: ADP-ribosylglycohydrolase family protein [Thermoanaerobacterium]|uniref:ADP-ribosylglycohydrolase n=3 Tax=Thermoanaerobacterium TaxID=28895 RepID=L0IR02_THETR|nr:MULTISPECIES: ADP-ribosylglycohydrolase family protein [Thermoanaerobacterium]AFK94366.1 ADP-ribosylation/Crystallin J1 [Thermoanaerobacterium saccharolyticum JW/SL-YS485]AGB20402.1 ADP-ribosylglycohydrolase [Thermoanaerobacterium thermosaccharolyticum M0795]ETO39136.1 ADP-ribosylation/Crystallin J1 [Thermoanaerobacterium aotearoense SCUT27]
MDTNDKIYGGIYGVAIGDALGSTVEFVNQDFIKKTYGKLTEIIGGGWLNLKPGEWTDDTEMTLAVSRGIIENKENPFSYIGKEFLQWYKKKPKDIGVTIRTVFEMIRNNRNSLDYDLSDWLEASKLADSILGGKSAGNGALMRTLPIGIVYKNPYNIYDMAVNIAKMTHWDIRGGLTCAIYSLSVRNLLDNETDVLSSINKSFDLCEEISDGNNIKELEEIRESFKEADNKNPTGYTVDSFKCAALSVIEANNFEDAVINAVNLGGDADTIGAIAGGLAGVFWGFKAIPERWISKFSEQQRSILNDIAEKLSEIMTQ